jgi:hypothetical protein
MSAIFGETLVIEQEDGPPIELVVWGDEFYVRYETKEGYTVIYDSAAGRFCYADVRDGRFVSTGASAAPSAGSAGRPACAFRDALRSVTTAGGARRRR